MFPNSRFMVIKPKSKFSRSGTFFFIIYYYFLFIIIKHKIIHIVELHTERKRKKIEVRRVM